MRRLFAAMVLGLVVGLAGASSSGAATTTVTITKTGFHAQITAINVGDTVTWTNKDTVNHQVIADAGTFNSGVLKPGQSYSFTFSKADGYPYRDKLNESLRGEVNVNGPRDVTISQVGLAPSTINVGAGDTVTWFNRDTTGATHQIVADDGSFASPMLKQWATYAHTFPDGGTFSYHDGTHPTFKGQVAVAAAPPAVVVLQASRTTVLAGGTVTLTGSVAGGNAAQTVSILVQTTGQPLQTIDVTTDSTGAFSLNVNPAIGTTYQAVVKSVQSGTTRAQSSVIDVQVVPQVTLRRIGLGRYAAFVTDMNAVAGNFVYITRWMPTQHRWILLTKVTLRSTVTSNVFSTGFIERTHHLRLRIYLPAAQAGDGYLAGYSGALIS
jgi:plastocyanin